MTAIKDKGIEGMKHWQMSVPCRNCLSISTLGYFIIEGNIHVIWACDSCGDFAEKRITTYEKIPAHISTDCARSAVKEFYKNNIYPAVVAIRDEAKRRGLIKQELGINKTNGGG